MKSVMIVLVAIAASLCGCVSQTYHDKMVKDAFDMGYRSAGGDAYRCVQELNQLKVGLQQAYDKQKKEQEIKK